MAMGSDPKLEQARRLLRGGETEAARAIAVRLVKQHPDDPAANQLMCLVMMRQREFGKALYYAERASKADPRSGELLCNLAHCHSLSGHSDEAIGLYRRALEIDGSLSLARLGLADAFAEAGRGDEAIEVLRSLLTDEPGLVRASRLLGSLLLDRSRQEEAVAVLRAAVARAPDDLDLRTGLVSALNYLEGAAPEEVFRAHVAFGEAQARAAPTLTAPARPRDRSDGRLHLGILSADLRVHSCSSYLEPLLESLDRRAFQVTLYSNHVNTDAMTERFRELADLFRSVVGVPDDRAAEMIRADGIDILIECNGHTEGQRFGILQRKPAPLQGTYLGYPNTTGLRAIDFRVVDSSTDPPGPADALAVERLVRLDPSFLCYRPPREAGEVSLPPCATNGYVTLGSFNNAQKMTGRVIRLWSRLVRDVRGSRLILKYFAMRDPGVRAELSRRFAAKGMPEGALELLEPQPGRGHHLATYARIDIGLDPFPYHGTTTTCEAFHMGIPVVTLEGDVHASRVGVSLLRSIGMPELIAPNEDDYVRIVRELAADPERIAAIRSSLRERLATSPLCDGPAFGERFGAAMKQLWSENRDRARKV